MPATTAAIAANDPMTRVRRTMVLPTKLSLPRRGDGASSISLIWGSAQPNRLGLLAYLAALAVGAVACLVYAVAVGWSGPLWVLLILAALAAAAERSSVRVLADVEVSISLLPVVFAAVALGPLEAIIVGAASMATLPLPAMRWAVYTAARAITAAATASIAIAAESFALQDKFVATAVATILAAVGAHALDGLLSGITVALRKVRLDEAVRYLVPQTVVSSLLTATVVGPLAHAYLSVSRWVVVLFLPPALVAQRLFALYQEQRELAGDLRTVNDRLERASLSFARSLVAALDARDRYTAGHSAAVAIYSRDIAREMELPEVAVQQAHLAGLLHDIGKVGLPPEVLEKAGPLTPEERLRMEEHPVIGERILRNVEDYDETATIVRHHHERVDGHGYPDGIVAEDIPAISRIICVADAYNAMTSGRPYRGALPVGEALRRLEDGAGTQFDPEVVEAFLALLGGRGDLYARGATAHFALEAQAHPELSDIAASAA